MEPIRDGIVFRGLVGFKCPDSLERSCNVFPRAFEAILFLGCIITIAGDI